MAVLGLFLLGWLAGTLATLIIVGASMWVSIRRQDDA
jgi:hypothetical protein